MVHYLNTCKTSFKKAQSLTQHLIILLFKVKENTHEYNIYFNKLIHMYFVYICTPGSHEDSYFLKRPFRVTLFIV